MANWIRAVKPTFKHLLKTDAFVGEFLDECPGRGTMYIYIVRRRMADGKERYFVYSEPKKYEVVNGEDEEDECLRLE